MKRKITRKALETAFARAYRQLVYRRQDTVDSIKVDYKNHWTVIVETRHYQTLPEAILDMIDDCEYRGTDLLADDAPDLYLDGQKVNDVELMYIVVLMTDEGSKWE